MKHAKVIVIVGGSTVLIAGVLWGLVFLTRPVKEVGPDASLTSTSLSSHPIYSQHEFGQEPNVIDMGIQPPWMPTAMVTEAMKRDKLLSHRLSRLGMQMRFHGFLKGADINFFLKRGDVDVAVGGAMPTLAAAVEGDIVVSSLIQQGFHSIVARQQMLIRNLKDLRIGYAWGSNSHYTLLQTLTSAGLKEKDVQLISYEVAEMPAALDSGNIDAYSAWEPIPTIAVSHFKGQAIIHRSITSGYLYFSQPFAKKHPKVVQEIVAAEIRALNWLASDEYHLHEAGEWVLEAIETLTGDPAPLSIHQCAKLAKENLMGSFPGPQLSKTDLEPGGRLSQEYAFLLKLGKLSSTHKWEKVAESFDLSIVESVLSRPKRYQLYRYAYMTDRERNDATE